MAQRGAKGSDMFTAITAEWIPATARDASGATVPDADTIIATEETAIMVIDVSTASVKGTATATASDIGFGAGKVK